MANKNLFASLSEGNNIDSLITAPLEAISKANAMMLGAQTQFILDYCFRKNEESYSPVMIKLEYSNKNDIKEYFEVPLLSILPLNTLAVNKVDLRFNLEVMSTERFELPGQEKEINNELTETSLLQRKTKIYAKVSSVIKSKNVSKTTKGIDFSIITKQIPLTKGITNLIDVYSKNIIVSKE